MSYEQVEEAWALSDAARDYARDAGREPSRDDYWKDVFSGSPLVDVERSLREGGDAPEKVYLTSPYGLQWRADHKDWIPFRHGEIPPFAG
jgi:hypothetical protein